MSDPLELFNAWHSEAKSAGEEQLDVMALATASSAAGPSLRMVSSKGFCEGKLRFFTNKLSRKAVELGENPQAAGLFYWSKLHRQVRIEGVVAELSRSEVEQYFATRSRPKQLAAWVSRQSEPLESFKVLQSEFLKLEQNFQRLVIPCPTTWSGYAIEVHRFEFWRGHASRLHERIHFENENGKWKRNWLVP